MFLCSYVPGFSACVTKHDNGYYIFLITLIKSSHIYKRLIITIYDKPYYKI